MLNYSLMSQQGNLYNNNFSQGGMPQGDMMMGMHQSSDYDMMALIRAKEKLGMMQGGMMQGAMMQGAMMQGGMMQRGPSMQDKFRAFSQDQFAKGQGLPLSNNNGFDNYNASSLLDNLGIKRSSSEMMQASMPLPVEKQVPPEEPTTKRRKKAKKPSDMPRRALSAYNIFFSEQRGVILKEIEAKEKGEKSDDASTTSEENQEGAKKSEEAKTEGEEKDEETESKSDEAKDEVPKVLNRTFFPKRAKRAHRKVHGKIGLVQLARTVSQRWKELSPEKRQHYKELAEKDKERHAKVMAEYQNRKAAEGMVSMGATEDKDEETPVDTVSETPRQPSEQEKRESLAEMMQQKILADMFAARQPQQQQQNMMGMSGMQQMMSQQVPSMSNFQHNGLQNGMLGSNFQQHNSLQNGMLGLQNGSQMWQQMGMGNF
jgi:hypothetical protein